MSVLRFIVFSDDWGRHPSSCQHLFGQLLRRYRAHWVNTIGMRTPRLNWATVQRGMEKILHWTRRSDTSSSPLPENLRVSNPKMWPWFGSRLSRRINRALLSRHLRRLAADFSEPPVVVTTIPITADLPERFPEWHWVYYCVDDFSQWPGLDQRTMERMERKLVAECDQAVAVSSTLQQRLRDMGKEAPLLTHGVDLEHWREGEERPLPVLRELEPPIVLFWGVVDRRMDVEWMHRLADDLSQGTLVLLGPVNDPDPALLRHPRVASLGPQPFADLPAFAREASVLIMPYADLPVTRAMQPLKLKEYLATGKPTVVRALPAYADWSDCADMVESASDFVAAVQRRLETGLPADQQVARERLREESWDAKARQLEKWILQGRQEASG